MSKEKEMLDELKQIRELLTPGPAPPPPKNLLEEFKHFLKSYKVIGLAVAFIMGIYLGALIGALVTDLVMPIVEFFLPPGVAFESWTVGPFRIGHFLGQLIIFIIVALVIFLLVKLTKRMGLE
ncbi:MAG: MscL family protein [Promethearchaeia archaeon]